VEDTLPSGQIVHEQLSFRRKPSTAASGFDMHFSSTRAVLVRQTKPPVRYQFLKDIRLKQRTFIDVCNRMVINIVFLPMGALMNWLEEVLAMSALHLHPVEVLVRDLSHPHKHNDALLSM
jgi:hypothetical protein